MGALLWINGPFGGGKTQTAYELKRRLPGSVVCDPEHVGFGPHRTLPPGLRGDFQDLRAWRQGVREVLDLALREHSGNGARPAAGHGQRAAAPAAADLDGHQAHPVRLNRRAGAGRGAQRRIPSRKSLPSRATTVRSSWCSTYRPRRRVVIRPAFLSTVR